MYMMRLTLSLAIWLSWLSFSSASLAPRKERPSFERKRPAAFDLATQKAAPLASKNRLTQTIAPAQESEYLLTANTEVLLDGQSCRYEEVPATASILRMEVGPDRKTVIRVYFRARK
jgi:hypothetical protein